MPRIKWQNYDVEADDDDDENGDKPTTGESHRASPTPAARGPGLRKEEKIFVDVDQPSTAVESDEAHEEIMDKCDFLASEIAHHVEWTEKGIKDRMEDRHTKAMLALIGETFKAPVGGLQGLSEEIRKVVSNLATSAAAQIAALDCKVERLGTPHSTDALERKVEELSAN